MRPWKNQFLADRMAFWLPNFTVEEIATGLAQLADAPFNELFAEVYKLNTSHNLRFSSKLLARHGWFIDLEMTPGTATELAQLIEGQRAEEAYVALESYFEARRSQIEGELKARFPRRSALVEKCFRLHDAADYEAAVPLCLIQADGICFDLFGVELFRVKRKALAVRSKIDAKDVDWLWNAMAEPFREVLPIAAHSARESGTFNRHLILHGANLDYGTKRNSLRAISLLSYLQAIAEYENMRTADGTGGREPRGQTSRAATPEN